MDALQSVHRANGLLVLVGFLALAWIAAAAQLRRAEPGRTRRIGIIVVSALVGIQALLGIALAIGGRRPGNGLHFVVGPLTLVVLPLAVRLGAGRTRRAATTIFTAGAATGFVLALIALGTSGLNN